jgi:cyclic pyranopterin phosphate synthase
MAEMVDSYGRKIEYLRLSITDRCNLRCFYCTRMDNIKWISHNEILTFEEMERFVRCAAKLGIKKVRITGGEPLLKKDLPYFIKLLANIDGIEDISLTTNGQLLSEYIYELKEAGLNRVNVSLDTLDEEKYRKMTGGGELNKVLQGIEACLEAGLHPLKINCVVIKKVNDDDIINLARLTLSIPVWVRFIEFMPVNLKWNYSGLVPQHEIKSRIEKEFSLEKVEDYTLAGKGPAQYYKISSSQGGIGFIDGATGSYCNKCNRIRLSCDGKLRSCLFSEWSLNVKEVLRNYDLSIDEVDSQLRMLIKQIVIYKEEKGLKSFKGNEIPMMKIGG